MGPLEVGVGGQTVVVGRPKQRALLAALALSPGTCISRDRLIDELWGEAPPDSATHALQVHISALRKLLGADAIATCPGGYKLDVAADAVDARRAESLLAAGDAEAALALFRGAPLEGIELEGPAAYEAQRLDDLRAEALETRFERALDAGQGAALVSQIERFVADHPLRERPRGQLMRALHQAGRTADALAAFQAARRTFVDELGLEPSPALRELERAILNDELAVPARPTPAAPAIASRRWRGALALALAALATAAGVLAAVLLPTSNPSAATRQTSSSSPDSTPATVVAAPTRVSHRTRRRAVHHAARRVRPAVKARAVRHHAVVPRKAHPTAVAPTTTVRPAPAPAPVRTVPTTTAPRVVPHPVATTTAPATTTTAPPTSTNGPIRIVDNFNSPLVDDSTWNIFLNGTNVFAVRKNGKLLLTLGAGAQPGGSYHFVGAQYGTKQCFAGDIDMQVDYQLVQWPEGSGAWIGLQAVFANAMVELFASQGATADQYSSMIGPVFHNADASGTSGSLRLTRVKGVVTTYYLADGQWQVIDSGVAASPAHLHIGLSLVPNTSPSQDIVVALDNFSATAYGPTTC